MIDYQKLNTDLFNIFNISAKGFGDSDRHLLTLFAIAHASRSKTYMELGVRSGGTTLPLVMAAHANNGTLHSVDIADTEFNCPPEYQRNWQFHKCDALKFLKDWNKEERVDFIYIDDWHAYDHVRDELAQVDEMIGPSSVVLIHDLMWGGHAPYYHCDLTLSDGQWANGGPYRAVCELNSQFWEFSTIPWCNGLTLLRKKYSSLFHSG
jgi:predicted O-methyltransferase YrrM